MAKFEATKQPANFLMQTLLVTGGCGFIGSNFIRMVMENEESFNIVNLDKLTYAGNVDNLEFIPKSRYKFVQGDICNKKLVSKLFDDFTFDGLIHFAAESHVDRSIDGPSNFINTNILGTLNLLEQSRSFLDKNAGSNFRFIHISTDEVFGSLDETGRFQENTPYDPSSPYSASKASSDHLVRAWHRTYGLPTLLTNCSNNYGPFQFPEKLIPLMIINCFDQKTLPVYGEGENIRDWLFVSDHCEAILEVYRNGVIGNTYNIGGNNELKNIDIVNRVCSLMDEFYPQKYVEKYADLITFVKDRPGHDFRYAIDSSKIYNDLGWEPVESFETGIKKTVNWYLNNVKWWRRIQNKTYKQERLGI